MSAKKRLLTWPERGFLGITRTHGHDVDAQRDVAVLP
jgi:hypothetical protein